MLNWLARARTIRKLNRLADNVLQKHPSAKYATQLATLRQAIDRKKIPVPADTNPSTILTAAIGRRRSVTI